MPAAIKAKTNKPALITTHVSLMIFHKTMPIAISRYTIKHLPRRYFISSMPQYDTIQATL